MIDQELVLASLHESMRQFENIAQRMRNECEPEYCVSIAEHAVKEIRASIRSHESYLAPIRDRFDELVELEYRMSGA